VSGLADQVRSLIDYNEWANAKIFDAADGLTDEQLDSRSTASFETIRGSLTHILWAQRIWHARWTRTTADSPDSSTLESIRRGFEESHNDLREFASGLNDQGAVGSFDYSDSKGIPYRRGLGSLMIHMVNHGTYHRGEVALMLTAMDRSPGDLDYVYFLPSEV